MRLTYLWTISLSWMGVLSIVSAQEMEKNKIWKSVASYQKGLSFVQNIQGNWGLCKENKTLLVPAVYDTIYSLDKVTFDPAMFSFEHVYTDFFITEKGEEHSLWNLKGAQIFTANSIMNRIMGDMLLVRKDGAWGLMNTAGKVVLPVVCPKIDWYDDLLGLNYNKQWILLDAKKGKLLKEVTYDTLLEVDVYPYEHQNKAWILAQQKDKWGLINEQAQVRIPFEMQAIKILRPSLGRQHKALRFLVQKEGKWGVVTDENKLQIPLVYEQLDVTSSDQSIIVFKKNNHWGIVTNKGKELLNNCSKITSVGGGALYRIYQHKKVGLFREKGHLIVPIVYDSIQMGKLFFHAYSQGKLIYIDKTTLQERSIPTHDDADYFSGQYFKYKKNNQWGLMDFNGKIVHEAHYDKIQSTNHHSRFLIYKKGKVGLMNAEGQELAAPIYEQIQMIPLRRGDLRQHKLLFCVQQAEKYGLLDYEGKSLWTPTFDVFKYDRKLFDGYIRVEKEGKKGLLRWDGTTVLEVVYDAYRRLTYRSNYQNKDGVWKVKKGEKNGLVSIYQAQATTVLPVDYASIVRVSSVCARIDHLFVVEQNGKFGLYDVQKKAWSIPIQYDAIDSHSICSEQNELRFNVELKGEKFVLDEQGKVVK